MTVSVPAHDNPVLDNAVLDNAVWHTLAGEHARFAEVVGVVRRYHPDIAPFAALPDEPDEPAWRELAALVGAGNIAVLSRPVIDPLAGWQELDRGVGLQMIGDAVVGEHDDEALVLGAADVPEMLALVERAEPGPFRPRTIELGKYLGIRRGGALVAMAGERMRPAGHTEISAVCTDAEFRGQGLAARLVRAVAAGVQERGETPMLHVRKSNTGAVRLYEALGFATRIETFFVGLRAPDVA
ncbi:MAG TPA: GNAT family N-acetyltransferase [Jatrophihabitans sp.]